MFDFPQLYFPYKPFHINIASNRGLHFVAIYWLCRSLIFFLLLWYTLASVIRMYSSLGANQHFLIALNVCSLYYYWSTGDLWAKIAKFTNKDCSIFCVVIKNPDWSINHNVAWYLSLATLGHTIVHSCFNTAVLLGEMCPFDPVQLK